MNHINYFKNYNNDLLTSVELGFLRGNMFNELYKPYRNYSLDKYKPINEKDKLMYDISMYAFAMNDLVLYLDMNPNDYNAVNKFVEYRTKYCQLVEEYENKYNPLTIDSTALSTTPWKWLNGWPEGGR